MEEHTKTLEQKIEAQNEVIAKLMETMEELETKWKNNRQFEGEEPPRVVGIGFPKDFDIGSNSTRISLYAPKHDSLSSMGLTPRCGWRDAIAILVFANWQMIIRYILNVCIDPALLRPDKLMMICFYLVLDT